MLLVLFVLVRGGLGTIPQLDPHVGVNHRFRWTDIHQEHAAQDLPEVRGEVGLELVSYAGNAHEQAVEEVLVVSRKGEGRGYELEIQLKLSLFANLMNKWEVSLIKLPSL